ncbi:hypothetical protein [Rhizobium sp. RCAM05973]|uniref:hypothetical protein n=1 Tax=Rhizobium sp. RCAM05973 TaxID=2994066 RepID=UPI0022EBF8ED|nr:hypothetical protein [Rhizobium sp. RCAM05973]
MRSSTDEKPTRVFCAANDNEPRKTVRMVPHNGGCSTTSGRVPVSVRHIAALDLVAA